MIVRNEEHTLPTALASVEGLADEIVILDTGSGDDTITVARGLGARVLEGGDRMHKGEARNQAMDAATGDWIVALDADERIADPTGLRSFLETTDAQGIYVTESNMDCNGDPTLSWYRMLCWRRGAFRYKYRCHEVPIPTNGWGKLAYTKFVWEHRPPPGRNWKSDYTLNRLLLDVQENPNDARPHYYLGRQYTYRGMWDEGIEMLARYLQMGGTQDRANAYGFLAQCYAGLEKESERIESLHRALALQLDRRDWWGQLAAIYHAKGQDMIAVALLKAALELPPSTRDYMQQYWYGPAIYDLLARCLWKLERHYEGRTFAEKALSLSPRDARLVDNLRYFTQSRFIQLRRVVPELYYESGTLLYVGANQLREPQGLASMRRAGHEITLLEVWPDNVAHFRAGTQFNHVVEGDVREVASLSLPHAHYDAVLWWHGPEHVDLEEWPDTLAQLESLADLVVLGCPWGVMEQEALYGNHHEEHRTHPEPENFPMYATDTVGEKDTRSGHLIAWK